MPRQLSSSISLSLRMWGMLLSQNFPCFSYMKKIMLLMQTKIHWKTRAIHHLSFILWFTSFHTSGSTLLVNKHTMVLETYGVLIHFIRSDISQLPRITSESNERTYRNWRQILCEFKKILTLLMSHVQKFACQDDLKIVHMYTF